MDFNKVCLGQIHKYKNVNILKNIKLYKLRINLKVNGL